MFTLKIGTQAKKDFKRLKKTSLNDFISSQEFVLNLLNNGYCDINQKHKPHKLIGNYIDCYECHIKSDLLLIWKENKEKNIIHIIRIGSHSNLFK